MRPVWLASWAAFLCLDAIADTTTKLRLLEGRWSNSDCSKVFTEFRFSEPNYRGLRMKWGPGFGTHSYAVEVERDASGQLILFFPALNHRTVVVFVTDDLRETMDIEPDGRKTMSVWKRCSAQELGHPHQHGHLDRAGG
jgi:hypothetical protein